MIYCGALWRKQPRNFADFICNAFVPHVGPSPLCRRLTYSMEAFSFSVAAGLREHEVCQCTSAFVSCMMFGGCLKSTTMLINKFYTELRAHSG